MAKAGGPLDMNKEEIRNHVLQNLGSAPSSPVIGQSYFDTFVGRPLWWNGTAWRNFATDTATFNGNIYSYYLARGNHTGNQAASTISDLASVVQAYRLDQFAAPTSNVSFNSQRAVSLSDAVNPTDAVTLQQAQALSQASAAGIDAKASVRLATTGNVGLSGLAAIDGVTPVDGDRILAWQQTTQSQNGIYNAHSGAWTRATDCNSSANYTPQAFTFVEEGGQAGNQYKVSTTGTITPGTTAVVWVQFGASSVYTASNGLQLTSGAFSVKLPANSGLVADGTGLYLDVTKTPKFYTTTFGDGSATSYVITHNLNSRNVQYSIYATATPYEDLAIPTVQRTSVNTLTVFFGSNSVPTSGQWTIVVSGVSGL